MPAFCRAVLWINRSGAQWRLASRIRELEQRLRRPLGPRRLGTNASTLLRRPDLGDSTVAAHPCAAGAPPRVARRPGPGQAEAGSAPIHVSVHPPILTGGPARHHPGGVDRQDLQDITGACHGVPGRGHSTCSAITSSLLDNFARILAALRPAPGVEQIVPMAVNP